MWPSYWITCFLPLWVSKITTQKHQNKHRDQTNVNSTQLNVRKPTHDIYLFTSVLTSEHTVQRVRYHPLLILTSCSYQFPSSLPSCMPSNIRRRTAHLSPPLSLHQTPHSPPTPPSYLCTTTLHTPSATPIFPSLLLHPVLIEVLGSKIVLLRDVKRTVSFWRRRMLELGCCLPPKPWCSSFSTLLWAL